MNRDAVGVGSWLLRQTVRPVSASLDTQETGILEQASFRHWQAEQLEGGDKAYAALLALVQETWRDELSPDERAVLAGLHLHGKSEAALAREFGLHHSTVGRTRRKGEEKLRRALGYALRYRALLMRGKSPDDLQT